MRGRVKMCGIAGIVDLGGQRDIDRDALARMSAKLIHRGPDGDGMFVDPGIGLAHRRLAIIDPKGGAQPFHTQDGMGVLSYNGEIYNYDTLRQALASNGQTSHTQSDTEVLAEGLHRFGATYVDQLRGMFAFSFWDKEQRALILARDRLGERPLYYAQTDDNFLVFASEINALLASGLVGREHNREAIADYFHYGYVPDPKTIYAGIEKLPPGHILFAKPSNPIRIERYWRPVFAQSAHISFEDCAELLKDKIDDAVRAQLVSDVPLGAFLSGGVDSSGIVASMSTNAKELITCTVGFDDKAFDERPYARQIAEQYNSRHHEHVTNLDGAELIQTIANSYGEPFADTSALTTYMVAKLARENVTVAISGDGGDEIFAGYRRYRFLLAEQQIRKALPGVIGHSLFGVFGAAYPKLDWAPRYLRAKTTFQSLAKPYARAYADAVAINLPSAVQNIFSQDFKDTTKDYHPASVIEDAMKDAKTDDPLARMQYADLMTWLPGRMLTKVDRASMAHSLEVRPPLLDHQLVEWAGLLPASYKLENGTGKRVLKAALSSYLPNEILTRPKQGFAIPVDDWLRRESSNPVDLLMRANSWSRSGLFDTAAVERMIKEHKSGVRNFGQELWSLVMFNGFLNQET